jgi:predicted acetyltransferase
MQPIVYLVKPTIELKSGYLSFYQEWKESGEDMIPWVISKDPKDFQGMIKFLLDSEKDENIPENWVPCSTYWLVNDNKKVIGAVNIRHRLNDSLFNSGGHIGYGIRPSERRKGFATQLLSLSLVKAKELGLHEVLVVCDSNNIGSAKTILNNGGVPDSNFIEKNGNIIKRF